MGEHGNYGRGDYCRQRVWDNGDMIDCGEATVGESGRCSAHQPKPDPMTELRAQLAELRSELMDVHAVLGDAPAATTATTHGHTMAAVGAGRSGVWMADMFKSLDPSTTTAGYYARCGLPIVVRDDLFPHRWTDPETGHVEMIHGTATGGTLYCSTQMAEAIANQKGGERG